MPRLCAWLGNAAGRPVGLDADAASPASLLLQRDKDGTARLLWPAKDGTVSGGWPWAYVLCRIEIKL